MLLLKEGLLPFSLAEGILLALQGGKWLPLQEVSSNTPVRNVLSFKWPPCSLYSQLLGPGFHYNSAIVGS